MRIGILVTAACLVWFQAGRSSAMDVSGVITSDQVWRTDTPADTVRIRSDVYVRDGATVSIRPGTVIRGYNSSGSVWKYNVFIEGSAKIQANGTADSMVVFRNVCVEFSALTDDAGNWLKYCSFFNGWGHSLVEFRNPSDPADENEISEVLIEDCRFTNGSYCLSYITSGARPVFRRCTFENSNGAGIFVHGGGDLVVDSCVFNGLSAAFCCGGMGLSRKWWEPLAACVNHCTFNDINRRGGGFTTVEVANDYGITTINYPGTLYVRNSIFHDIGASGIRDWNIEDATFSENWTVISDYNLYYALGGDPVRMLPAGSHSLEADPLLADAAAGDFSLRAGSPALGAADDGLNMGAVQNTPAASVEMLRPDVPQEGIGISIRSGADGTVLFMLSERMPGVLVVYDAAGNEAARLPVRERPAVRWNGAAPAGVYYIRLTTDPAGTVRQFLNVH